MFQKKGVGHAAIEGREGLYQVTAVNDGMMVGSGKIIKGANPEIGLEPEFAFLNGNEIFDFGMSIGSQN